MTAATVKLSTRKLSNMVDKLGTLNAQISALQKQANELKDTLKSSGLEDINGTMYRAKIVTKTTARIDTSAVREFLTPMQVDACTVESTSTSISLYDL